MISFRYILFFMVHACLCFAQGHKKTNWEVGGFLGASNYLGDLAPSIAILETKPVIGASGKYNFNGYVGAGVQLNLGWISGNDSNFKSLEQRGLSFRSSIMEVSGQVEFNFFRFLSGPRSREFSPYLYTGFSVFKFNPVADYEGEGHYLRNLSTEGQEVIDGSPRKYALIQFAIPIGAGLKFNVADNWNIAVHGGYRTTFTDYLDDVSREYVPADVLPGREAQYFADPTGKNPPGKQRGNEYNKDWYIFSGVSISYILFGPDCYIF